MSRRLARLVGAAAVTLALAALGLLIFHNSTVNSSAVTAVPASPSSTAAPCVRSTTDSYRIRTNAAGQTYGSSANADPDLVAVALPDTCTRAYVYRGALDGPEPRNPAEALAHQASKEGRNGHDVPAYASDGTTVLGTFHVGGSSES